MANPWFRLWTDMPTDPKFRTISRISGQPIALVLSVYLHILVDASNAVKRGETQCNAEDIASALDAETSDILSVIEAMQGRVLDGKMVTGWERRQPQREDSKATERVREWRKRNETQCNAVKRPEEIRVDTEKTKKEPIAQTAIAVRAVFDLPLPGNQGEWGVPEALYREMVVCHPGVEVMAELGKMRGWLVANPSRRKTARGLPAFISNWLSKTQNAAKPMPPQPMKIKFLGEANA